MSEIKAGDKVVLTDKVADSGVYTFVREGVEGTVTTVHDKYKDYPYSVVFEGEFVVDPHGCPTIVRNPNLLFDTDEIKLKEEK
jgi:hypothetical protein